MNTSRIAISFVAISLSMGLSIFPLSLIGKEAKEVELRFDGRQRINEPYQIYVDSKRERTYRMKLVGITNSPRRRETCETHASGELIFHSFNPFVVQYKVETLLQIVDGVTIDYTPLAGMIAEIRSSGVNLRDIPLGIGEDATKNVLGAGAVDTKTAEDIQAMLPDARRLIASMFASPLDHPEDYLGKKRKVKPGDKWPASVKPMLDAIKANGLDLPEDRIIATATYNSTSKDKSGIPVHRVYFLAESDSVPGYDFKLEVFFSFLESGDDAPLQIERNATEVVNRTIPEGVPGFSSAELDCVTKDVSIIRMIRQPRRTNDR